VPLEQSIANAERSPSHHSCSKRVTVTSRSGSSTVSPARASAYARLPPTLMAEYAGGRWRSAPVGSAKGSGGTRPGAISPSRSPVVDV
jgi:hypothetical protein